MSVVIVLLAIAWLALMVGLRVSALVGRGAAVHRADRRTRQAIAYRKRLARDLHAKC